MDKEYIKTLKRLMPSEMEYSVILNTPKDMDKFIKRCEKTIRSSQEYRDYISFLRENVDMDKCAFFNGINNSSRRVRIEIHHEPFTLYDIVSTVVDKFIEEGIPLNDLMIADEVMELHYNNEVGLIPLSKTIHEVVHKSNKITIPLNLVYGNYKKFVEEYNISEALFEKLESKINMTKALNTSSFDVLNKQFEYIEVDGVSLPQKMEVPGQMVS